MSDEPGTPSPPRPEIGPFVLLGVPVLVEVATIYFLIAVETPLSPWVHDLLARRFGMVILAAVGLMAVLVVMFVLLSWIEWRHRRGSRTPPGMGE